jgi:GTP-binding protein HflX
MWSHLMGEQTRGGIGSRFGQGESQLEVDRRLVRDRISTLRRELAGLESRRTTQSKARWDSGIYRVALAGYTNAGKSTLLNALTGSDVYSKDELFATLDPTTRALDLSEGRRITITDTVGFIQKLPTTLVEAFKSTLSEVRSADLILLVVDASEPNYERQVKAVNDVLDEIGAGDVTTLLVFNKCDLAGPDVLASLRSLHPEACLISAFEKRGLEGLMFQISTIASQGDVSITATIPYDKGMLIKLVHERGQVLRESYEQEGLVVTARVSPRLCSSLAPYLTGGGDLD